MRSSAGVSRLAGIWVDIIVVANDIGRQNANDDDGPDDNQRPSNGAQSLALLLAGRGLGRLLVVSQRRCKAQELPVVWASQPQAKAVTLRCAQFDAAVQP